MSAAAALIIMRASSRARYIGSRPYGSYGSYGSFKDSSSQIAEWEIPLMEEVKPLPRVKHPTVSMSIVVRNLLVSVVLLMFLTVLKLIIFG